MATLQQKYMRIRVSMGFLIIFFLFLVIGQGMLYPLVLRFNNTGYPTDYFLTVITCSLFAFFVGVIIAVRIIGETYSEFLF
jgi:hypothetical protein